MGAWGRGIKVASLWGREWVRVGDTWKDRF